MKKQILWMLLLLIGTATGFAQEVDTTAIDTTPPDEEVIHSAEVIFNLDKGMITVDETVNPNYFTDYGGYEHYAARQLYIYTIENGQKEQLLENFCRADFVQKGKKLDLYLWLSELNEAGFYEKKEELSVDAEVVIHFVVGKKSLKCTLEEINGTSLTDELSKANTEMKNTLEEYKSVKSFKPWIEALFKTIEQNYNFCIGLRGKDLSLDETRAMCKKYQNAVQKPYEQITTLLPSDNDFNRHSLLSSIEGITPRTQQMTGKIAGNDTLYTIVVKNYIGKEAIEEEPEGAETDSLETLVVVMLEITSPAQKQPLQFIDKTIKSFTHSDKVLSQPVYRLLDDGTIEGKILLDKEGVKGQFVETLSYNASEQSLVRLTEHIEGTEKDEREVEYTIKYLKPEPLDRVE